MRKRDLPSLHTPQDTAYPQFPRESQALFPSQESAETRSRLRASEGQLKSSRHGACRPWSSPVPRGGGGAIQVGPSPVPLGGGGAAPVGPSPVSPQRPSPLDSSPFLSIMLLASSFLASSFGFILLSESNATAPNGPVTIWKQEVERTTPHFHLALTPSPSSEP